MTSCFAEADSVQWMAAGERASANTDPRILELSRRNICARWFVVLQ